MATTLCLIALRPADDWTPKEVSPAALRQDTHTKTPDDTISKIQGLLIRLEGIDPSLRKAVCGHSILPDSCCTGGTHPR